LHDVHLIGVKLTQHRVQKAVPGACRRRRTKAEPVQLRRAPKSTGLQYDALVATIAQFHMRQHIPCDIGVWR